MVISLHFLPSFLSKTKSTLDLPSVIGPLRLLVAFTHPAEAISLFFVTSRRDSPLSRGDVLLLSRVPYTGRLPGRMCLCG